MENTDNTTDLSLVIVTKGEVIQSNLPEFALALRNRLSEIKRELITDDDFVEAESEVKTLKAVEDAIKSAKQRALSDSSQLDRLFSELDSLADEVAAARLSHTRQITARKEELRESLVAEYLCKFEGIPVHLAKRQYEATFRQHSKGKRTIKGIRDALSALLGSLQARINSGRQIIDHYVHEHGHELVPDADELILKGPESVEIELRRRVEVRKQNELRRQAEERARAEAEERRKLEAQLRAQQAATAPAQTPAPAQAPAPAPAQAMLPAFMQRNPVAAQQPQEMDVPPWERPAAPAPKRIDFEVVDFELFAETYPSLIIRTTNAAAIQTNLEKSYARNGKLPEVKGLRVFFS